MPKYEQLEHLRSPPSIDYSIKKSLETPYFVQGQWPEASWWTVFNEPELNDLIALSLSNNPTLQEVARRVDYARQEALIVKAKLFPLITFDAEDTREHLSKNGLYRALNPNIPINVNLADLTLNFTYEFDFWGKNANLFSAALGRNHAAQAEWAEVELITTTALSQAFFALKTNLTRKKLLQELISARKNLFLLQNLLQKRALSSKLTPLLYEENVYEAEKLCADIEAEIDSNKHTINILAGRSPDFPLCIEASLTSLPKSLTIPCNLSLDLLARRPDLMAQIWRAKALAHEVGAAIADFYPDINLHTFIGLESTTMSRLFTAGSIQFGLTPAIHLPIFTAGAIRAHVNAKRSLFHQAIFAYNALLLKSAAEVCDLLSLVQSIFYQKIAQEKIVENAEKLYQLTQLRQKKGLNNLFENYDTQIALIEKKLQDITLLYNEYVAALTLIKALGGGYHSECIPLHVEDIL